MTNRTGRIPLQINVSQPTESRDLGKGPIEMEKVKQTGVGQTVVQNGGRVDSQYRYNRTPFHFRSVCAPSPPPPAGVFRLYSRALTLSANERRFYIRLAR